MFLNESMVLEKFRNETNLVMKSVISPKNEVQQASLSQIIAMLTYGGGPKAAPLKADSLLISVAKIIDCENLPKNS